MRKVLIAIVSMIALFSCASPVMNTVQTEGRSIVNSEWKIVKTVQVSKGREASVLTLADEVAIHNATTMDDFWWIYPEGEVPRIEDAPPLTVYFVNPYTYAVNYKEENVVRKLFVDHIAGWRASAGAQLLYIDHIPPKPVYPWESTPYEWYAFYVLDEAGQIVYEDHCGYLPDESFVGQWILLPLDQTAPDGTPGGGWASIDAYYWQKTQAWKTEIVPHAGWSMIEHQLYTAPVY